jgi:hypothetical protein
MAGPVLVLAVLVAGLAVTSFALREAGYATSLRYARMAWGHEADADSWRPMLKALDAWDAGQPIYEMVFFRNRVKFQYPLTSLLLPMALRSDVRRGDTLITALNCASLLVSMVFVACTAALFVVTWFGPRPDWRAWPVWIGAGTVIVGAVLFYPALMAYVLGQIQTFVNASCAAMLLAWRLNKRAVAGVALGLACLLKPHLALFLVWGLLRRAWSFVAAAAVVVILGGATAVALFGLRDNLDYARVVSYMAARGEAIYANQSVNGLLNRLVQPPSERQWDFHSFPPPHPVVRIGTVVAGLALVVTALALPPSLGFAGSALDMATMSLSITMAPPIAWEHHYGVLLPILIVASGAALRMTPPRRGLLILLGMSLALAGSLWEPLTLVEDPPANLVQSYVLAAAVMTLVVLYRLGPIAARAKDPAGE